MTSTTRFIVLCLVALSLATSAGEAIDKKLQSIAPTPAPAALPAVLDAVTFDFKADSESHKVVVIATPTLLRVDEPGDGYSVIYDPATEHFTGLEHRNYTWWEFSWPQVREAVQNSKRNEARLQDLNNQGLNGDMITPTTNAPAATSSTSTDLDDSGYVWQPTTDKKSIDDIDCVRWTGSTQSGETVDAWCSPTPMPKVQAAIDRLRLINEPMALVPIRTIVPDFIFPVYRALAKGGCTPVRIEWGDAHNRNVFRLVEINSRTGKTSLFAVPKLYMKTTLISMDGLIEQQPAPAPRKTQPQKTWQD